MRFPPLLLLLAACAGPAELRKAPRPPAGPAAPVRHQLADGAVVRLAPATSSPEDPESNAFADALLQEALRQSIRFDFAGGVETTEADQTVTFHADAQARRWSSTLTRAGEPPVPLASVAGEMPGVLDALALATRQALGETVATAPLPAAAIYSSDPDCVALTEKARRATARGDRRKAVQFLRRARSRDSGCTVTLTGLASALVSTGAGRRGQRQLSEAERIAREALQLELRLSATTRHRLAHALLIARAQDRARATDVFRELLTLGEVALRERPHDPHALHSKVVALNYLRRYHESLPLLQRLSQRWPQNAEVGYHLCFAELATGNPTAALAAIRNATERLPRNAVVVPTALSLYHCDRHDELRSYLADLAQDPTYRKSAELHELRRIQIAHALLTDRAEDATRLILEDLEWIRQRPSGLEQRALDVAEVGEVMVAMGRADALRRPLQAFEALGDLPPTFSQAMVFLGGLVEVSTRKARAEIAEAHLDKSGQTVWSSVLRAAAHRSRGELQDELRERLFQYQSTEMPLVRAALARVCRAAGLGEQAEQAITELRERLLAFDLLRPREHPLMSPAAALAFLVTKGS